MRRCLPGTFDEAVTRLPPPALSAGVTYAVRGPRRPLSRVAAMALTGANVGLRQVIAAAILVHIVVLFPLAVASR
jgi:hypothetical protein